MTAKRIPLFDVKLHGTAIRDVHDTLLSGWLTTGSKAAAFEQAVAEYCDVPYAAAVNSATTGLLLSLKALGIGAGDEVITTPLTFIATIEAIAHAGATPVLCDVEPSTLTLDPEQVARKLSKRTKAILPVDIAGYPANYAAIRQAIEGRKIAILSDSSHAFGALCHGQSIPQVADMSVFSFHSTKNLTCGEGGMVVSRNKKLVEQVRLLTKHAMTKNAFQRRAEGTWEYDVIDLGFKGNMSDIHAAVGLGQLKHFDADQAKRARLAARYTASLGELSEYIALPVVEPDVRHAWHLYIVQLQMNRLSMTRNQFIAAMAERGIECGVHYKPVFDLSYYRGLGFSGEQLPNAARAGKRVVSLPMFAGLPLSKVDFVCDAVADIVRGSVRVRRAR